MAYGWEHYDWERADACATNENSARTYVDLFRGVTLTPTVSLKRDDYRLNLNTQAGLNYYKAVFAGAEVVWLISPGTRFLVSYMNDRRNQLITSAGQRRSPSLPWRLATMRWGLPLPLRSQLLPSGTLLCLRLLPA